MFPLKDNIPSRRFPCITVSLIIINVLVFFYELSLGPHLQHFIFEYGIVPRRFMLLPNCSLISFKYKYLPLFTSMFLHGGWLHLIGNMWYLWIFGDNVEDRMGRLRFLIFYLLCGIAAALVHIYTNSYSALPCIGASGAISGVMGAYYVLFPYARIITLVPIFFFITFIEIPALFFLLFWFMFQFFNGAFSIIAPGFYSAVAWWAHIGGFISGVILVFFFKRKNTRPHFLDEYRPW